MTFHKLNRSGFVLGMCLMSLTLFTQAAANPVCSAKSGERKVALLELYTSEGCNSCPPADKWVSSLPARGFATDRVIALSLHVDYWNYLGWKDPFSQHKFSQRQSSSNAQAGSAFVYTPQILLNGRDYRRGFLWDNFRSKIDEINRSKPQAELDLEISHLAPARLEVTARALVPDMTLRKHAQIYLALYENNLGNDVKAGENAGRTLQHDFVVRELVGPVLADSQGKVTLFQGLSLHNGWKKQDSVIAAFVQNSLTGEVLQALALPVCK